jgi:hypothetical protein
MARTKKKPATRLKRATTTVHIHGKRLLMHPWSKKALETMLDKQTGKAPTAKQPRDLEGDYQTSIYWEHGNTGRMGFPATAFKSAMTRAGKSLGYVMKDLCCQLYVQADGLWVCEHDYGVMTREIVIVHGTPEPDGDITKVGQGTTDYRVRALLPDWWVALRIDFLTGPLSSARVAGLVEAAGWVGVGDWRGERGGGNGRWDLCTEREYADAVKSLAG